MNQPAVIAAYNQEMGGVDLLDHTLSDLRPVIRGKKWYWPLVINTLNITFVYSLRVFRIITGTNASKTLLLANCRDFDMTCSF